MKKILKISLIALSFVFFMGLVSCDKETPENPLDNVIDYSGYPDIDMEVIRETGPTLSSLSFDTTNAKVHYYVGEKFTLEGLIVKANYVKYVNNAYQQTSVEVENYFYDISEADLNTPGIYNVEFTYRELNKVITSNLQITVTPSYLADLKVEYLAGLEPTETVITISKGSNFDPVKNVTFLKKYMTGTDEGLKETKAEDMTEADLAKLEVTTTLNTSKTGKYVVNYEFDTSVVQNDGKTYEYTLKSFVVVIVK